MKRTILIIYCFFNVAVYAQPGSLDNSFGIGGKITKDFFNNSEVGLAVAFQNDNKILLGGYNSTSGLWGGNDFTIIRFKNDGGLDTTFGTGGKVTTDFGNSLDFCSSLTTQTDGKILLGGNIYLATGSSYDFAIVRYNSNGSLDSTFGLSGKVIIDIGNYDDYLKSVAVQNDGKIILAGYSYNESNNDFVLVRLNTDGTLDSTFDNDGKLISDFGGENIIRSMKIQNDGKLLVAGAINDSLAVARYNSDGTLDNSFGVGGIISISFGYVEDMGRSIAIQNDGKIIVMATSWDGLGVDLSLVRLNSNGSLDNTFGLAGKVTTVRDPSTIGSAVMIQSDGKVVVVGDSYKNGYDFIVLRYNDNGSLDSTFDYDGIVTTDFGSWHDRGFSGGLQNDGKIVVVGNSYNGTDYDFAVARYTSGIEVGIPENKANTDVSIYPNPTSGIFNVNVPYSQYARICVYDGFGNCLLKKHFLNDANLMIDLRSEPQGIYFVETVTDGKTFKSKIVVQ